MSGYVFCTSPCVCCRTLFSYNPNHVPSTKLFSGVREPVCKPCMTAVNAKRQAGGREPFRIHPQAYEPEPESELLDE